MKIRRYIHLLDGEICKFKENGVYYIRHVDKPNMFYIGSTFRKPNKKDKVGIYYRFIEHLSKLKNGNHHSLYLQRICNKYGIDKIRCGIFQINNITEDNVIIREQFYIDKYKTYNPKFGFNMSNIAKGVSQSLENRKKSSIRMKKNNPMKSSDAIKKMIQTMKETEPIILQYTTEGKLINKFKGISEASFNAGVHSSNLFRAAIGETTTSANYIWFYEADFTTEKLQNRIKKYNTPKKFTKESILKRSISNYTPIIQYDKEGNFIKEYVSIKDASEVIGCKACGISRAANGVYKTCGGFIWKYKH
jgi:hypothetical protein